MGIWYESRTQPREARREYQAALERDPNFLPAILRFVARSHAS